jgi:ribosomal protein L40E
MTSAIAGVKSISKPNRMEMKSMRTGMRIAVLVALLISSLAFLPAVCANPGVHVAVLHSPLTVGQSVHITYYSSPGEDGNATVYIKSSSGGSNIWSSAPLRNSGGLAYEVTAPGLSTPGTYIAGVTVSLTKGGDINAEAAFEVLWSSTTTAEAEFDFWLMVSPSEQTVIPGGSTTYTVTVGIASGSQQTVDLSVPDAAAGISTSFDPPSGDPTYTSLLTVSTTQSIQPGQVVMTVTATGGGKTYRATITLIVSAATQTEAQSSQPTQTGQPVPSTGVFEAVQENSLIIVGALVALIVLFAALAVRRRRPAKEISKPKTASSIFCTSCGTENPVTNEFCGKCGQKLVRPD